jgi:hypothetical protein
LRMLAVLDGVGAPLRNAMKSRRGRWLLRVAEAPQGEAAVLYRAARRRAGASAELRLCRLNSHRTRFGLVSKADLDRLAIQVEALFDDFLLYP